MAGNAEKHDSTSRRRLSPRKPRWTSSAKTGVGTAISKRSRVCFRVGQGVLNELYFPDIDKANTRTIRFLIADGEDFFSDGEHDATHKVTAFEDGVPGYAIVSTCKRGRYRITKEIVTEAVRDTLLLRASFEPLESPASLKFYLYVEPPLGDQGAGNSCWIGGYDCSRPGGHRRSRSFAALRFCKRAAALSRHRMESGPWTGGQSLDNGADAWTSLGTAGTSHRMEGDSHCNSAGRGHTAYPGDRPVESVAPARPSRERSIRSCAP
jgi:GH15 family glucan-1,4-alpha-glucosidase